MTDELDRFIVEKADRTWPRLRLFYNWRGDKFAKFKRKPTQKSKDVIEISEWSGRSIKNSLWIQISDYKNQIILDSSVILALAKEITRIQRGSR